MMICSLCYRVKCIQVWAFSVLVLYDLASTICVIYLFTNFAIFMLNIEQRLLMLYDILSCDVNFSQVIFTIRRL